jgi:hypothetical protein
MITCLSSYMPGMFRIAGITAGIFFIIAGIPFAIESMPFAMGGIPLIMGSMLFMLRGVADFSFAGFSFAGFSLAGFSLAGFSFASFSFAGCAITGPRPPESSLAIEPLKLQSAPGSNRTYRIVPCIYR